LVPQLRDPRDADEPGLEDQVILKVTNFCNYKYL
jgi:hypothetical protein